VDEISAHFRKGVELFNRGDFFEAHEEMEDAMNLIGDDASDRDAGDWEFFLGLLRAAVAHHQIGERNLPGAILHLRAALKFLAAYPDRHRGLKLRELRAALTAQLARLEASEPPLSAPRIEMAATASADDKL